MTTKGVPPVDTNDEQVEKALDLDDGRSRPTAQQIADYFMAHLGYPTTDAERRKIHYLLYYTQGFALAMRGEPLFDDAIIATKHGLEVPTVTFLELEEFHEV